MDPSSFESPPGSPPTGEPVGGASAPPGGMVIVIQSQMTLLLSLSMLIVGLLVGFLLRPALWPTPAAVVEVTVTKAAASAENTKAPEALPTAGTVDTAGVTLPTTPTPDLTAQKQELMKVLIAQTRHFIGAEDAPITLIEFSDFQ